MTLTRKLMNHYRQLCEHLKKRLKDYEEFGLPEELRRRLQDCDRELMEYRSMGTIKELTEYIQKCQRLEENARKELKLDLDTLMKDKMAVVSDQLQHIDADEEGYYEESDGEVCRALMRMYKSIVEFLETPRYLILDPKPIRKLSIPDERSEE